MSLQVSSQPIRFRNLGDWCIINSLFNVKHFFLKFEFCIPYAAFVQNASHVSGENVGMINYI